VKKAPKGKSDHRARSFDATWTAFEEDSRMFWTEMNSLVEMLDGVEAEGAGDA
jgi:hypothetical protein